MFSKVPMMKKKSETKPTTKYTRVITSFEIQIQHQKLSIFLFKTMTCVDLKNYGDF
jgi:hypothetical protein